VACDCTSAAIVANTVESSVRTGTWTRAGCRGTPAADAIHASSNEAPPIYAARRLVVIENPANCTTFRSKPLLAARDSLSG
jgi:hypothetical protein